MAAARSQSEREETFEVGLKAITEICPIAGLPSLDYATRVGLFLEASILGIGRGEIIKVTINSN